jgi:hypothetical protein
MTTELQLKRPIDGLTLAIIREIHAAASALGQFKEGFGYMK